MGAACNQIRRALLELGRFSSEESALDRDVESPLSAIESRALGGLWLSRFEFRSRQKRTYTAGRQYGLEELVPQGNRTLIGANLLARSSNGRDYRHQLRLIIVKSHVIGRWFNVNHESVGACQLRVHSNRNVLEGLHLGDADDESVQMGKWAWIRLLDGKQKDAPKAKARPIVERALISASALDAVFDSYLTQGDWRSPCRRYWNGDVATAPAVWPVLQPPIPTARPTVSARRLVAAVGCLPSE